MAVLPSSTAGLSARRVDSETRTPQDDNKPPGTYVQPHEPLLAGWIVCVEMMFNNEDNQPQQQWTTDIG